MNFNTFIKELEDEIEFSFPKNPLLGLTVFLMALLKQVLGRNKTLEKQVDEYLKLTGPLIFLCLKLGPDKMYDLAKYRIPDMRGRIKPKKLQNISEEYYDIYEKVKPVLRRKYKNPKAKLHDLKERLEGLPTEMLSFSWIDLEPRNFVAQYLAYKYGKKRHPETILRTVRKEMKTKRLYKQAADHLSELLKQNLSSKK